MPSVKNTANPNPYEERARRRKAADLTSHLRGKGVTSEKLAKMRPEERRWHATTAGVKNPSEETWNMALSSLQFLEENERKHPDPFEGL